MQLNQKLQKKYNIYTIVVWQRGIKNREIILTIFYLI